MPYTTVQLIELHYMYFVSNYTAHVLASHIHIASLSRCHCNWRGLREINALLSDINGSDESCYSVARGIAGMQISDGELLV